MSGSAWDFGIVTERLQDKENNVLGDDGEINQLKIHKCNKKRGPQKWIELKKFKKLLSFVPSHSKMQFYDNKNAISGHVRFWR